MQYPVHTAQGRSGAPAKHARGRGGRQKPNLKEREEGKKGGGDRKNLFQLGFMLLVTAVSVVIMWQVAASIRARAAVSR